MYRLYVLNSAVMPQDGDYSRYTITPEQAAEMLQSAETIVSSVAYPAVCQVIKELSGVTVPLDVEKRRTEFTGEEATILAVTLKYRPKAEAKGMKDRNLKITEYQFVKFKYSQM